MTKIHNNNPEEWRKVIEIVEQMQFGEITIKVQQGKITISEYTVKKKPEDEPGEEDGLMTRTL